MTAIKSKVVQYIVYPNRALASVLDNLCAAIVITNLILHLITLRLFLNYLFSQYIVYSFFVHYLLISDRDLLWLLLLFKTCEHWSLNKTGQLQNTNYVPRPTLAGRFAKAKKNKKHF